MAPNRRGVSASNKRHQQQTSGSQPSQSGIQRFFGKDARSSSSAPHDGASKAPLEVAPGCSSSGRRGNDSDSPPVAQQPHAPPGEMNVSKVDTEVTPVTGGRNKNPPLIADKRRRDKRFRISPGMLTQQSQDDGWDQVVWRISPTAERLQGVSCAENSHQSRSDVLALQCNKNVTNLPSVDKILTRASSGSSETSVTCTGKKGSPGLAGKLEQWLATSAKHQGNCASLLGGVKVIPRYTTSQDVQNQNERSPSFLSDKENNEAAPIANLGRVSSSTKMSQRHSKRQTVLSLSRRHVVVSKTQRKRVNIKQKGLGQRRKALLELLDKVQNVISVSEYTSSFGDCFSNKVLGQSTVVEGEEPIHEAPGVEIVAGGRESSETISKHRNVDATVVNTDQNSRLLLTEVDTSRRERSALETSADNKEGASNTSTAEPQIKLFESGAPTVNNTGAAVHHLECDQQLCHEGAAVTPENLASIHFLVLEVADFADECSEFTSPRKVLRLLNEHSGLERVSYLIDEWFFTVVRPGDTVNVIGDFDSDGKCIIDRKNNLLIVHPDVLISGSKVGTSFSCPRRAVLDDRIKSSAVSFAALLGTMTHQLFQIGLISNVANKAVLEEEAETIVQQHIHSLYACGGNEQDALDKLKDFIPTILNWLDCFLRAPVKGPAVPKVDFGRKDGLLSVSISEVLDIEEMIYSPKFGLKGMIDASLRVKPGGLNLGDQGWILPLEFKTGKGTTGQAAVEHRAQVMLYGLLMSDRYGQNIDRGLLYYLHSNQTQGVTVQQMDLIGLIMRRNEHAANLLLTSSAQQLPPMIQNVNMCQGCWHLDTCSIYHKAQEGGTMESSGIGELFKEQTDHLSGHHFEFLRLWDRLIDLEAQELEASKREIWRLPSCQREEAGRCISSMRISDLNQDLWNKQTGANGFVYCFHRDISSVNQNNGLKSGRDKVQQVGDLHKLPFSCGDHVLLSTESGHTAVAAGFISNVTEGSVLKIQITLSHQLRLPGKNGISNFEYLQQQVWRIDKDETASFLATMRFNVLQLFVKSDGHEQGRRLIVDLQPPKFDSGGIFSQDPATLYVQSAPDLNDDQRRAIFKVLSARDYALILGMPGTGKTSTIVHSVRALLTRGASILITSYTNSAVDNILLKLKSQGVDFVRLGREGAIHPELKEHVIEGLGLRTVKDLEIRMNKVCVVAATCLGVTHPLLTNRKFNVCIVDEAGQISLPVCLGPLRFANTFVLVGDHYQLPPLVRNAEARERGLAVSLFRRLSEAHPQAISALQCQYRMCAGIMSLCNTLIYGHRLRCGSPEVANAQLGITDHRTDRPLWLQKVTDTACSVVFLNTDLLFSPDMHIRSAVNNTTEASVVLKVINYFLEVGINCEDIGVISPYNYQVQLIRQLLAADGITRLEVHTIDRFQGRDKDCVLVSFVKSANQSRSSSTLLADWHRINVAITRAKKKLVLVGSKKTLTATPVLNLLIKQVEQAGGLVYIPQEAGLSNGLRRCNKLDLVSQN